MSISSDNEGRKPRETFTGKAEKRADREAIDAIAQYVEGAIDHEVLVDKEGVTDIYVPEWMRGDFQSDFIPHAARMADRFGKAHCLPIDLDDEDAPVQDFMPNALTFWVGKDALANGGAISFERRLQKFVLNLEIKHGLPEGALAVRFYNPPLTFRDQLKPDIEPTVGGAVVLAVRPAYSHKLPELAETIAAHDARIDQPVTDDPSAFEERATYWQDVTGAEVAPDAHRERKILALRDALAQFRTTKDKTMLPMVTVPIREGVGRLELHEPFMEQLGHANVTFNALLDKELAQLPRQHINTDGLAIFLKPAVNGPAKPFMKESLEGLRKLEMDKLCDMISVRYKIPVKGTLVHLAGKLGNDPERQPGDVLLLTTLPQYQHTLQFTAKRDLGETHAVMIGNVRETKDAQPGDVREYGGWLDRRAAESPVR